MCKFDNVDAPLRFKRSGFAAVCVELYFLIHKDGFGFLTLTCESKDVNCIFFQNIKAKVEFVQPELGIF